MDEFRSFGIEEKISQVKRVQQVLKEIRNNKYIELDMRQ